MIYLDNAATGGKKPERVIKAVENALRNHSANPGRSGHKASLGAGNILYQCRIDRYADDNQKRLQTQRTKGFQVILPAGSATVPTRSSVGTTKSACTTAFSPPTASRPITTRPVRLAHFSR